MNKVLQTLKQDKFKTLMLMWSCPATKTICVRDRATRVTTVIKLK